MDSQLAIDATRRWVADVVVGLNLCPFARRVFDAGLIRYVVTDADTEDGLLADLSRELLALAAAPRTEVETTLLIHPRALADFLDYNDFLAAADRLVRARGLQGTIQVASFHPAYRFAGTAPDAAENYTNRPAGAMTIPRRNVATLRKLGRDEMRQRLRAAHDQNQQPFPTGANPFPGE